MGKPHKPVVKRARRKRYLERKRLRVRDAITKSHSK